MSQEVGTEDGVGNGGQNKGKGELAAAEVHSRPLGTPGRNDSTASGQKVRAVGRLGRLMGNNTAFSAGVYEEVTAGTAVKEMFFVISSLFCLTYIILRV